MSLNHFPAFIKNLTTLIILFFSVNFIYAQDAINVFGQTGTARLDVDTDYTFSITQTSNPPQNTAAAVWTVTSEGATFGAPDVIMTNAPGATPSIRFSNSLITGANIGKVYTVSVTFGATGSASINVVLLPYGGLIKENLTITFRKRDKVTGLFSNITTLDITKGETLSQDEGELVQLVLTLNPNPPTLPLSLTKLSKIGFKVTQVNNSPLPAFLYNGVRPVLLQLLGYRVPNGNLNNSSIPAPNALTNNNGSKEFVFYSYANLPYQYRMDTVDYNNISPGAETVPISSPTRYDNASSDEFRFDVSDPRINFDYLRSKLWMSTTFTEIQALNLGYTQTATGAMITDNLSLVYRGAALGFTPSATPSVNSVNGFLDTVVANRIHSNQFACTLSGLTGTIDLPLAALEHGGVGQVKLNVDIYGSTSGSFTATATPSVSTALIVDVAPKLPNMQLRLELDGETVGNIDSITTVPGKDINLNIFVTRKYEGVGSANPFMPAYEGISGAQEYIVIDHDIAWAFKNFDESVFDKMEFDPADTSLPKTQTDQGILFHGITGRPAWKHHGLHLNLQTFSGASTNPLFNDLFFLIDKDRTSPYTVANDLVGTVMISNGRYTVPPVPRDAPHLNVKFGLLLNSNTVPLFAHSQARLYTVDTNLRVGLPNEVEFTPNLFGNRRGELPGILPPPLPPPVITPQRAITFVPRVVGTFPITVSLKTPEGTDIVVKVATINVIPEVINIRTADVAEPDDVVAKPVRAGDPITYQDKVMTSTYSDFGITGFTMRMEGVGPKAADILWNETTGINGAASFGEVDLDDLAYFSFLVQKADDYRFTFLSPNQGGVIGVLNRSDLDGDNVSEENFFDSTGRPEPFYLRFNGIDDDNDGLIDDGPSMPAGRAESAAIRINTAERSTYYQGGTLRKYYGTSTNNFSALVVDLNLFRNDINALKTLSGFLTVAILESVRLAHLPAGNDAGVVAAFNQIKTDPFLANMLSGQRRNWLLDKILQAIDVYEYNTIGYGQMVNEIRLPQVVPTSRPTDDFAPIPNLTGTGFNIPLNEYRGQIIAYNNYTINSSPFIKPMKLATAISRCEPPAWEAFFEFTHQVPWVNRNGNKGFVPLTFVKKNVGLSTAFEFSPSNSVSDKKFTGPYADIGVYPGFINSSMQLIGQPSFTQNYSTTFKFTGGVNLAHSNFVNRLTNNYRPYLNMFEPEFPPDPRAYNLDYANLAGLAGWVFTYSETTLTLVNDGATAEAKTWVVEQRAGPIVDLPHALYTVTDPLTFNFVRQTEIIIPEEDSRFRPDDVQLQGVESWFRGFPVREVIATESKYVALFGIDEAYDPEHTPVPPFGMFGLYTISFMSPSPAFHELESNNTALRLFLPSEMLDNGTPLTSPFEIYRDADNSGTFNYAVDIMTSVPGAQIHNYDPLTKSYTTNILNTGFYDNVYDEQFDFFIVTRFDSGYPDIGTGLPPFPAGGTQPDSSAVRFGAKVELFKPSSFPKALPAYANFIDRDGKADIGDVSTPGIQALINTGLQQAAISISENASQDNFVIVDARNDENDVDMKIDIYADSDHPLESAGFVVHQGGTAVIAMKNSDQIGGPTTSGVIKEVRSPKDLLASSFATATQKFGVAAYPFVPFSRAALSTLILTGDAVNPPIFPVSAQGTSATSVFTSHIHLPPLPAKEMTSNYDRVIERQKTWRNDVYAQVRPFERDKNGNGVCDPEEDFNSDGYFTQDVLLLKFIPEKYPAGHPKAGQSFYNESNDFLNMADIRWSIVKNESGSYLSSDAGYLIPGDSTGTNYVTYYPGPLNGIDWVKGENIKTGRSLIAAVLVANNTATDGIDNDGDAPIGTFVTTIGTLVGLSTSDPRYGIKCINPSAQFNSSVASALENFPNIDFADDDSFDGAASLDPGYPGYSLFSGIATDSANKGNAILRPTGVYYDLSDKSMVLTVIDIGITGGATTTTLGFDAIAFRLSYVDSVTLATTTLLLNMRAGSPSLVLYRNPTNGSEIVGNFSLMGVSRIDVGDKFKFNVLGGNLSDWDGDGYRRSNELGGPAMFPETGYQMGLDIDLSWNNPRPFYAIKVRANKPENDAYNGEYGKNYQATFYLKTKEVVGSGVWTSTVEMQLNDGRYLGSPNNSLFSYYASNAIVNNTLSASSTSGNVLTIVGTPTILGGVDLIRVSQNTNAIMRGEWMDSVGDNGDIPLGGNRRGNYRGEICLLTGPHWTTDDLGRNIYDFDITTMPGDNTRYASAVFESKHTIAEYSAPGRGILRIDPNSMPTPVLQLNAADTSDPITLTFTDGERLQKVRVNFLNVTSFKPRSITDDPNTNLQDTMLAPLSNDMLGGVSIWKDNKDPSNTVTTILNGIDLSTSSTTTALLTGGVGSRGQFDLLVDVIVDLDGYDSPRSYTNYTNQFSNPTTNKSPLTSFSKEDKLYFVDRDASKSFSLGDDIYLDQGQPGLDNGDKIIYTQRGLGVGSSLSLGDPAHNERLRYYDANDNNKYDNGEDIVFEGANLDGLWELPIDKYVPLDKDSLRWRWDKENNLWYIVLDLENDEEIPPEDIFTNLTDFANPANPVNIASLQFPGGLAPNFYSASDYHLCIRTSTNLDYLSAFMVEIPDYWKHTQALSNYDDIAGVWLASQPQTVTYPSMPGSSIISPIIVANMPLLIDDEAIDRPTRNRIGRNSKPFPVLGINFVDNVFNSLKIGNDLLKKVFGSNADYTLGSNYGVRLTQVNIDRKTVLEDLVVEFFNVGGGVGNTTSTGTISNTDFNPVSDFLALDRTCKGDDIFRSEDGTGVFSANDTKILRLGSYLANGRLYQDDLTVGKQGKQDTNIVYVDTNSNGVYDDNKDILVYDIDGLTSDSLPTGVRTFKFGDAILKRGFSNWDISLGAANDVTKLTPNDLTLIVGKQLSYDSTLWYEDDDESGGFSNETSLSGVALYRDRSDGSPYDNGKFDFSVTSKNETIVLDEVIYLEEIEYFGQPGQPQHQVRMRPAVFDVSTTLLSKVNVNGLADPSKTNVDKFVKLIPITDSNTFGGSGKDYRDQSLDDLFNPYIDLDANGVDDSNKLYPYNKDTSLPDHHPLRCNLFDDKVSPAYGDENGMGPYGEWGYLRAPMDDGQSSLSFDPSRATLRNSGNKHLGPDFFVAIRSSNVATNGDDFRAGISSWGRDPAHLMFSAPQKELGNRGFGFDDRVEDTELIGIGGGVNPAVPYLYSTAPGGPPVGFTGSSFGDITNSRTYTKFLSSVVLVDGQAPEDVKTLTASIYEESNLSGSSVPLEDQIKLTWEWLTDPDDDRAGAIIIRRKGLAPNLTLLEDGEYYIGPEITLEKGELNKKFLPGYLGFATKTKLTEAVSAGISLSSAISSTDVSISDASFANLPKPPQGGKCYLLIGATSGGGKAEIVSYTTVGSTIIVKRGELNTVAVSHSVNSSVTFMPPRPVEIAELVKDTSPSVGSPVLVKVDKSIGLAGFPETGVIRIGAEVMVYDGVTFGSTQDSLSVTTRGYDSTAIAKHSAQSKINWSYHPTYTSDTIKVESTSGFPVSGRLKIDNEEMWYNAKTGTSFKGIVRGIFTDDAHKTDTPVSSHLSGSEVIDSLYKVIMNDQDLDGPKDQNNDGNDDEIVKTWTDDLYYGDEPSAYFYYLFTYDDVLNYSDGKLASVNSMTIKQYIPATGNGVSAVTSNITFSNVNTGDKIEVKGGDTIYLAVDGGSPKFSWTASASGLSTETAPAGYDTKGESERYVSFTVPDIPEVDQTDIIITVTDSSANAQTLSVVLFVTEVTAPPADDTKLRVKSDIGSPNPIDTNIDATVTIKPGEIMTLTATVPSTGNINTVVWTAGPASTFGGVGLVTAPGKLVYQAVSSINPALQSGTDIIIVTDGIDTITITIIISDVDVAPPCTQSDTLSVVPGNSGSVIISPGSSVVFTATGGTCNYKWSLTANNSITATLVSKFNTATYTAGSENRQVDIVELSDGIATKTIKVKVTAASTNGRAGGGCFIRNKETQRD